MVRAGDDLPALILAGLTAPGRFCATATWWWSRRRSCRRPKAARSIWLTSCRPPQAIALAAEVGKDPRIVEVVLSESVEGRAQPAEPDDHAAPAGLRDGERRGGPVQCRGRPDGRHRALLLPLDPDGSAEAIRAALARQADVGVVISDSFGRPWRRGTAGVAIGSAGIPSVIDLRGQPDLFGRTLEVSIIGFADEIAAAASLLQGQAAEAQPVVVVRGLTWHAPDVPVADVIRPPEEDLFQ